MQSLLSIRLQKSLTPFLPENVLDKVVEEIVNRKIILTITQKRHSVYGDYRHPDFKAGHRISVNGDLNRFAFFITFMHELAHLIVWDLHRNKVAPHGAEWKKTFEEIMKPFINREVFPFEIEKALINYSKNAAASSCNDLELSKALSVFDKKAGVFVEDLLPGEKFELENRGVFQRGEKLRKRIRCVEMKTNRIYLFNPAAVVKKVDATNS